MKKIYHMLLYRFKPGKDRIDEHLEVISTFRNSTHGLDDLKCGRNVNPLCSDRFTHGFIMAFASKDALDKYNASGAHDDLEARFQDDLEDLFIFDFYG